MNPGKFKPGQSGNPEGGRLAQTSAVADVVKIARRRLTKPALKTLLDAMLDPNAPWNARIRAAEISLERAWGPAIHLDDALRNAKPEELEKLAKDIIEKREKERRSKLTVVAQSST